MKATVYFSENMAPPVELIGGALSAYEGGSLTHIKDYDREHHKIIFTAPTNKILFIQYDDIYPEVSVTVREIEKRPRVG